MPYNLSMIEEVPPAETASLIRDLPPLTSEEEEILQLFFFAAVRLRRSEELGKRKVTFADLAASNRELYAAYEAYDLLLDDALAKMHTRTKRLRRSVEKAVRKLRKARQL